MQKYNINCTTACAVVSKMVYYICPGAHATNDISIEFEIRTKLAVLWFKTHSTNHNKI